MAKKHTGKGIGLADAMPMKMSSEDKAREARYRAESDLRTLREAEQVRTDPARVRMAKVVAREEMKALAKVAKR